MLLDVMLLCKLHVMISTLYFFSEPNNVISILISSDFLKMDSLVGGYLDLSIISVVWVEISFSGII